MNFTRFFLLLAVFVCAGFSVSYGAVDLEGIGGVSDIKTIGMGSAPSSGGSDAVGKITGTGLSILQTVKTILSGLIVLYLVYAGAMMVIASGAEDEIAKQKRQIMYSIVAFLFINIPGTIVAVFFNKASTDVTATQTSQSFNGVQAQGSNLFVNFANWNTTVENGILSFVRVGLTGLVVFMLILGGIQLMASG